MSRARHTGNSDAPPPPPPPSGGGGAAQAKQAGQAGYAAGSSGGAILAGIPSPTSTRSGGGRLLDEMNSQVPPMKIPAVEKVRR